jgi:hypothetical protein
MYCSCSIAFFLDPFPFSQKGVVAHTFLYLDPTSPLKRLLRFALKLHSIFQCCESGSDRIGIIWTDPDLDLYPIQPNVELNYTFSQIISFSCPNSENYDTYDAEEKDKTM